MSLGNKNLKPQIKIVEDGLKKCGEECKEMFLKKFNIKVTLFEQFYKIK